MGEVLRERPLVGPEESENAESPDDFEQVVLDSLAQLPVRPIPLGSLQPEVEGIPGSSEFSQSGDDFYRQATRAEKREPAFYDGIWSVHPDEAEDWGFSSR